MDERQAHCGAAELEVCIAVPGAGVEDAWLWKSVQISIMS